MKSKSKELPKNEKGIEFIEASNDDVLLLNPKFETLRIITEKLLNKFDSHESFESNNEELSNVKKTPFLIIGPKHQFTPSLKDRSSDEELGENHAEEPSKGSSIKAVMYLMNTIIGGGVVSLPFVMSKFGLILGLLIYFFVYIMTLFSCLLLLRVKNNTKRSHYGTIGTFCFGYKGKMAIDIIIILNNFGMCMSYFIIFGRNLEKILQETTETTDWWTYRYIWVIIIWVLILPFVLYKNFDRLKFVSILSTTSIIIYFILTLYNFFQKWSKNDLAQNINIFPNENFDFKKGMGSFPSVFLAFTFQYNFFPVYKTVKDVDDRKMMWLSFIALSLVLIIYSLVGVCGYLSYGDKISINFLESVTIKDIGPLFYYILLIAFSTAVSFSVPLFFFGCRNYLLSLYQNIKRLCIDNKKYTKELMEKKPWGQRIHPNNNNDDNKAFLTVTMILYIVILICATTLKEIGPIFNIVGAVCANTISFLLPAAFYIKVIRKKCLVYKLAWFLFMIGIITGVLSLGGEIALKF